MKANYFHLHKEGHSEPLASRIQVANNPWSRFWGLMPRTNLEPGEGLWIVPCDSVHSCFMRFPFDAIFLSKEGEVLKVIPAMKPWRCSPLVKGARQVLELPSGFANEQGIDMNDRLFLEPV